MTLTVTGTVVQITGDADYNTIKNCTVTGQGQTGSSNCGVGITGGGNDYNVIENVTMNRSVYRLLYLFGADGSSDQGNEVRNCTLIGGVYGLYVAYQNGLVVHDCDIQPGYDGATTEIMGIMVYTQAAGELWTAYGNRIHNIRGSRTNDAIWASPHAGGLFRAYNNFVYDYEVNVTGTTYYSYVLRAASGTVEFYSNSVNIGDVVTASPIYGFYGGTAAVLKNNIFRIGEPTTTCYAIYRASGTLTSDYNCVYGTGTGYNMGRDGSTDYATLALWQSGTSRDSNSVEGDPGFVSATDLHIDSLATLVDSAATPIAGITTDIDGDVRNPTFPDIGADEYVAVYPPEEVDSLTVYPDVGAGNALLKWAPSARANSYKIYRGITYDFVIDGTTYIGQTASTSYTDVGVLATAGLKFYVVIASTDVIARER
jgi:hypothetical protein